MTPNEIEPEAPPRAQRPAWLQPVELPDVPWYRRFAVRLGVAVAGLILMTGAAYSVYYSSIKPRVVHARKTQYRPAYLDEDKEILERDGPGVARGKDGALLVSEEEWQRRMERYERNLSLAAAGVGVALASLLGWAISQRVTRRLRRMVEELQVPIGDDRALPGPFTITREDEIGALAGTMNQMRERIRALVEHLAQRDQDRRRWVALVSHDLRNPLQALTACIDRAIDEARQMRDDDRREHMLRLLGTARLDVDRFEVMTQDLLDIARLDAEGALDLEPVPPGQLARSAVAGMKVLAESNGRELGVDVEPGLPELSADGRRMLRALENLLRNAIQHAERRVTLEVRRDERSNVRFTVHDDGAGLPVEKDGEVDVSRLGAYKSRDDSAGLGLVVTRRVAEAHGGRIGAYNRNGDATAGGAHPGGSVWFSIPAAETSLEE